jgi:hypothetical protein
MEIGGSVGIGLKTEPLLVSPSGDSLGRRSSSFVAARRKNEGHVSLGLSTYIVSRSTVIEIRERDRTIILRLCCWIVEY